MTTTVVAAGAQVAMPHGVIDDRRGTWGMLLFILTEAALFLMFFFTYYYLSHVSRGPWPPEPPKLMFALVMLAVLVSSSVVLHLGERAEKEGRSGAARVFVGATVLMGIGFLVLQTLEYRNHLKTLTPMTDAYGSIFYTITSFHAAHLVLGLFMLLYVLALPQIGPGHKPPHRALHNASLYWHFVDLVWVLIVALLYVAPNIGR
jgi:heme/copper-type cytochrome/quinol oxidase subunit 3